MPVAFSSTWPHTSTNSEVRSLTDRSPRIAGGVRYAATSLGAELTILSRSKKATFWRELTAAFPAVIDYICNPNVGSQNLLKGLDEYVRRGLRR